MIQETRPWPRPVARLSQHIIDKLTERMRLMKKSESSLWVGLAADQQMSNHIAKSLSGHIITTEQLEDDQKQQTLDKSAQQYDVGVAHLIGSNNQKACPRLQALSHYVVPDSPIFISAITEIAIQKAGLANQLLCGQEALVSVGEIGESCSALGFHGIVLERITIHCAFPNREACVEDMAALLTGLFDGDSKQAEVLKARIEQGSTQLSSSQEHLVRVEVILGCMFSAKKSGREEERMIEVPVSEVKMRPPRSDKKDIV